MDITGTTGGLDILPDSRLQDRLKGVVRGTVNKLRSMNWTPVFCANCGTPHGYVPEEFCDFACFLCDSCSEKWGTQFGYALMPDEVFQAKVQQEMIDKYGRVLSVQEIQKATETDGSLSKLLREGR